MNDSGIILPDDYKFFDSKINYGLTQKQLEEQKTKVFKYMAYRYSGVDYGVTNIDDIAYIFDLYSVSGIYGTLKGFGSVNTSTVTYSSIDALLKSNLTTTYAISTSSITISYNANGGSGAPYNQTTTRTTYCTSTSAATTTGNTTISLSALLIGKLLLLLLKLA